MDRFVGTTKACSLAAGSLAPDVDDQICETGWILLENTANRIGNRLELIPSEARGHEDDAGVFSVRRDGLGSQLNEVTDIGSDDRPLLLRGVGELRAVITLDVTDLVRGDGINAGLAKNLGNDGRQILVEVDPHRTETTRTSPGYSRSSLSGVSALFASTFD